MFEKTKTSLPSSLNGSAINSNGNGKSLKSHTSQDNITLFSVGVGLGQTFVGVQDAATAEKIIKHFKLPNVPIIFVLGRYLLSSVCHDTDVDTIWCDCRRPGLG